MARSTAVTAASPPLQLKSKVRAFKNLKQWIEDGRLASGERLPSEQALASSLKVARSAVRSALQQLEEEGLVQQHGRRGRIVSETVRVAQTVMNQTVVLVTESPDLPPPHQRVTGWETYVWVGINAAVREAGMHSLAIHPSLFTPEQIHRLIADRPRGLVLRRDAVVGKQGEAAATELRAAGVPVVVYGYEPKLSGYDTVISDHAAGSYKLTRWLIEKGRKRILRYWPAMPPSEGPRPSWLTQRDVGYERALKEAGLPTIPPIETPVVTLHTTDRQHFEVAVRLAAGYLMPHMTGPNAVDAIMCASDGMVYWTAAACRLFGKIPGKDVLVVGYDRYWSDLVERSFEPSIPAATVDRLNLKIGRELVELLLARVNGKLPPEPQMRVVEPELVVLENESR